jgi:hypothetical protein
VPHGGAVVGEDVVAGLVGKRADDDCGGGAKERGRSYEQEVKENQRT